MSEELERLYAAHVERPFPPRLRTADVADVCFVMLDADVAACAGTVMKHGALDAHQEAVLARRRTDLDAVLPLLTDPVEVAYANGLREMAARCAGASRSL